MSSRKRVLVVGGTGYLGQHLLQGFSEIQGTPFEYDLAFTYYSNLPQPLLDALPHLLPFYVDLITGHGFDGISHSFGQMTASPRHATMERRGILTGELLLNKLEEVNKSVKKIELLIEKSHAAP